ncbi:integrase domain-containing protein [Yersinia enterocolitica]|uniref:integrase domain-containing protein n=1 Tax=Yersinia enterocolitica TaxID=630 RepID=UPI00398C981A
MAKLNKSLVTLARQAGGSFKTVSDRMKIADRLAERLLKMNIQIRDVSHLKTNHIAIYINSRLAENISKRTLQNEMAAIRAVLRLAGKTFMANPTHEKLSNNALGISGASRDGTKVAIPIDIYDSTLDKVREIDRGAAAVMELSRHLGLRTEEAIQSVKSLKTWQKAILNQQERIRVVFGSKGGRPRDTTIINRDSLAKVVTDAIKIAADNNGKLMDKMGIHLAIERYRNIVRDAGLVGQYAPHSLRYAYSRDALVYHRNKGFSQKEAEALVSMDLGHGDGRGHYVARIYNKVTIE